MPKLIILLLGFLVMGCQNDAGQKPAAAAPVRVAIVERGDITHSITAVGNVQSSATVSITPRVDGQIMEVFFVEGDEVAEGQPLLLIDPRPYTAILQEKKAMLAKSRAQLAKAEHDLARYAKLVNQGYISKEQYDQIATDAATLRATVEADKAELEAANLNLSYCTISAPINGRIGELKLHKGAMVKNNDSGPIATIDTISPCRVIFSVPEVHLRAIQEKLKIAPLAISAVPPGNEPQKGTITLLDNSIDTRTGAIRLRGEFANKPHVLWPGQYVEVEIPIGHAKNSLLIPSRAIQTGRDESYVYVIGEDNRANYKKVKVLVENAGMAAIEGELSPGERVVIDGHVRLAPGLPVKILEEAAQ